MSSREERKARREIRKGNCPTCGQELAERPKPSERRSMVSHPIFRAPGTPGTYMLSELERIDDGA